MAETWDGQDYQRRFDALAASGADLHGEVRFLLERLDRGGPADASRSATVLDAGCGTGRVAIELHRLGIDVTGVDVDPSMLEVARERGPAIPWTLADLSTLDLGTRFDAVIMAGNVVLFAAPGTHGAVIERTAAHVAAGGILVAGFSTDWSDRPFSVAAYDAHLEAAGHEVVARFATWDGDPWTPASTYAVTVSAPV